MFSQEKKPEEKVIPCLKNLFWASKNPGAVFFVLLVYLVRGNKMAPLFVVLPHKDVF